MRALRRIASLLFILCIPVALLTSNVRFMANEARVYRYAIDEFGAVQTTGIDRGELLSAGAQIRDYFNNDREQLNIRVQNKGQEVPLFSQKERDHMKDVKDRFRLMSRAQEFTVLFAISYIAAVVLWAKEVSLRGLAVHVALGCVLTLAIIGGLGAFTMAGFDAAWEQYHQLIFTNDFWLLDPRRDHLIQMFPPAFWESIVFFVGILVAAQAGLLLFCAGIYLGVTSRQPAPTQLEPSFGQY